MGVPTPAPKAYGPSPRSTPARFGDIPGPCPDVNWDNEMKHHTSMRHLANPIYVIINVFLEGCSYILLIIIPIHIPLNCHCMNVYLCWN